MSDTLSSLIQARFGESVDVPERLERNPELTGLAAHRSHRAFASEPVPPALRDRMEIILEGGVRRGVHVLKALALGATACSVGRPYLFGLGAGGEAGVDRALEILRADIERDMRLLGCRDVREITADRVRRAGL